jgi:hypothetical protein
MSIFTIRTFALLATFQWRGGEYAVMPAHNRSAPFQGRSLDGTLGDVSVRQQKRPTAATCFFERANAAGLPQEGDMNITKNLGMLLLAIYLILAGITLLFHITIPTIIMGILALVAGILILIGK